MSNYGKPIYGMVANEEPVVRTVHGLVKGQGRNGVGVFRGIPYGDRVDGDRRFQPPRAVGDWEGVLDCTKNGPIAMQFGTSISGSWDFGDYFSGGKRELFGCEDEVQSENCLVLDVVTPGIDDRKRPVAVYIHGGGYAGGSGTLVLGADRWVKEENIVAVGINHRLNVFGYLDLSAFDKRFERSGMAGILDLVLALEWVRDNIAAFGGDPARVTVMGESGGGSKINTLLAMDGAKGLFRAAIVESGSGIPGSMDSGEATDNAKALMSELGIGGDWQKLLELPAQDILSACDRAGIRRFSPSANDTDLPYNAAMKYLEADESLPLLVGSSSEEGGAFCEPEELTWDDLPDRLADGTIPGITKDNAGDVIARFRALDPSCDDPFRMLLRLQCLCGGRWTRSFNQALEKAEKGAGTVYSYLVTFPSPHARAPERRMAWHTADLPLQMRIVAHECCEGVSEKMAHAWAQFIRTGSPSTQELEWPAFTADGRETMVFDTVTGIKKDPMAPYRKYGR